MTKKNPTIGRHDYYSGDGHTEPSTNSSLSVRRIFPESFSYELYGCFFETKNLEQRLAKSIAVRSFYGLLARSACCCVGPTGSTRVLLGYADHDHAPAADSEGPESGVTNDVKKSRWHPVPSL
jgi:hypothetical protein